MGHRAVVDGRVLLVRRETVRACPTIRSASLSVGGEVNGLPHAVGTFVIDQRRQDAAVGFAITSVFLESDAAVSSAPVCDKKNEVLSNLSIHDVSILIVSCIKTAIMKVAIEIVS